MKFLNKKKVVKRNKCFLNIEPFFFINRKRAFFVIFFKIKIIKLKILYKDTIYYFYILIN